ncbi:MAG: phosphoglycerate mutase [Planctomycetaceae bacterium]|nr:MAG: phosphoglycerate mutase [Planctomycetaceae bacterium]
MSRQLLLMRHGKSSWDNPHLPDEERPLKPRGRKAARRIGRWLCEQGVELDFILCSTAVRAEQTCQELLAELRAQPMVEYHPTLYHAPPETILRVLRHLSDGVHIVLVIGHNPGLEEFVSQVWGEPVSFPTAALAWIDCPLASWNDIELNDCLRPRHLIRPRELGEEE